MVVRERTEGRFGSEYGEFFNSVADKIVNSLGLLDLTVGSYDSPIPFVWRLHSVSLVKLFL